MFTINWWKVCSMTDQSIERKLYSEHVIDNRRVSMVDALKYLLKQEEFKTLDVAVGYFYISGLLLLKDEFADFMDRRNGHFRILMGNETNGATVNILDGSNYRNYAELIASKSKHDTQDISDKKFLGKIAEWIDTGRIEVKVYTGQANYFHAKSYLFASTLNSDRGTAIVGSSNFSKAGLQGNTELNVLTQDGFFALHNWYNDLWLSKDEVTDFSPDLIKIVKSSGAKQRKPTTTLPICMVTHTLNLILVRTGLKNFSSISEAGLLVSKRNLIH